MRYLDFPAPKRLVQIPRVEVLFEYQTALKHRYNAIRLIIRNKLQNEQSDAAQTINLSRATIGDNKLSTYRLQWCSGNCKTRFLASNRLKPGESIITMTRLIVGYSAPSSTTIPVRPQLLAFCICIHLDTMLSPMR